MIKHALLDADGVLQRVHPGWEDVARRRVGARFQELVERFWVAEVPALRGEADVVETLGAVLAELGIEADAELLYPQIWLRTEVFDTTRPLVRRLRDAGMAVHLGTNQTRHRALHMRRTLGYDELFDVSVYSCDVGAAKPERAFYERAVALIDADPGEVLFVDDRPGNVEGARAAGLVSVHWEAGLGIAELESRLARSGVTLPG